MTAIEIEDTLAALLPRTVAQLQPDNAERLCVVSADARPSPSCRARHLLRWSRICPTTWPYRAAAPAGHLRCWRFGGSWCSWRLPTGWPQPPVEGLRGAQREVAWYAAANGWAPCRRPSSGRTQRRFGSVRLTRREPPTTGASREEVFAVIDAAFAQRRKMLRSALSGLFGSSAAASEAITAAGLDPTARGEVLAIGDFARIAEQLIEVRR